MALLGLVVTLAGLLIVVIVVPTQSKVQVSVLTSPPGEDFQIPAGKPFKISCQTAGDDEKNFSSMKWLNKDGKEIAEGNPGVQWKGNNLLLIFTNPNVEESGLYKCLSTYGGEFTLEKQVVISFYESKPTFVSGFENITVEEGSYVEILCQAMGELPIFYCWYDTNEDKITEDKNNNMFVTNSINGSELIIQEVTKSDKGAYTCMAENKHGLSSKVYELTVLSRTFPDNNTSNETVGIQNVTVRNVTSNSVQFDLELSVDAKIIQVNYSEVRNTTTYSLLWRYEDDFIVRGLIPGGLYSFTFRVFPGNKWTPSVNVTLLPGTPEVIFQSLEKGNVRVQWIRTFEDSMRETIDKYELSYRTVKMVRGSSWEPSQCFVTVTIPPCVGTAYVISGLYRQTFYEIQLKAHTKAGYGEPYRQKIYIAE